jgi:hypothetical protein
VSETKYGVCEYHHLVTVASGVNHNLNTEENNRLGGELFRRFVYTTAAIDCSDFTPNGKQMNSLGYVAELFA